MRCIIALIGIVLFSSSASLANTIACPAIVVAPQGLAHQIQDWTEFSDSSNAYYSLDNVSFYQGQPGLTISLPPTVNTVNYEEWKLDKGRQYFIACGYNHTSVEVTQPLPNDITNCRVTYQNYGIVNTKATPYAIDCW